MKVVFVTVVRNQKMYHEFVKDNPFNSGADFVWYDNTQENIYLPKRYNDFLDHYDYSQPAWFVFCHEDWQTKSDWLYKLKHLNKKSLYGICGTQLVIKNKQYAVQYYLGQMMGSDKRGLRKRLIGAKVKTGTVVDTVDCLCLILHSSLIEKYHIRFDENLTWHLYAEEMCIRLREKFNISTRILQIQSQHWSWGEANEEFDRSFNYLIKKFGKTKSLYSCSCSDKTIMPTKYVTEFKDSFDILTTYFSLFGIPLWKKSKYVDML